MEDKLNKESAAAPELLPQERPEEYLGRVTGSLRSTSGISLDKGMSLQSKPENEQYIEGALRKLEANAGQAKEKFSAEKNEEVLKQVERLITPASNVTKSDEVLPYAHTNQNRQFMGVVGRSDNIPYSHSLFGVGLETPEAKEYLKKAVEGKTVYLLGGGDSIVDLITSDDMAPKQVVNFDPFIASEDVQKAKNKNYMSVPLLAEDSASIGKEVERLGIEPAQEIWASYSVPFYMGKPEQIVGLFQTIKNSLAEDGVARITPIAMQREDEESFAALKEVFMGEVKSLTDSPNFNVYTLEGVTGSTLFIERLKTPNLEEEARAVAQQEQRQFVREERRKEVKQKIIEIRQSLGMRVE